VYVRPKRPSLERHTNLSTQFFKSDAVAIRSKIAVFLDRTEVLRDIRTRYARYRTGTEGYR
jgi:hypothetical protein